MTAATLAELRAALRKRHVLETAIELEREIDAQRLDERIARAGYPTKRKRRWPRERSPLEGTNAVMRRGPETWGDRVRANIR